MARLKRVFGGLSGRIILLVLLVGSLIASFDYLMEAIQSSHDIIRDRMRRRTQELHTLNTIITSLSRTKNPDEILQKALQLTMEFTDCSMGWCYISGDDGWHRLYQRCPPEYAGQLPSIVRPGVGVLGKSMEEREALFLEPERSDGREDLAFNLPRGVFVALPLRSPSRVLGIICLASQQRRKLRENTREALTAMAGEIGIAMENALLFLELQNHIGELEKANRELRGLDEMKSNFISAVTHELKQPLALIGGYAQTVHDYYESLTYEEEIHCLQVIKDRTQFLAALVEDLLDLSMLEVGRIRLQKEELDLIELARKIAADYIAGGLVVDIDFRDDFPMLIADARRMEQVLSNLLSNAVKFSHGKGEIRISGRVKMDHAQVRVEDQGAGINPQQLEKIFDRFYQVDATTSRPYPGVGLGLFICRQLVEAHGGRIWAENRPEGGAAVVFEVPMHSQEEVEA